MEKRTYAIREKDKARDVTGYVFDSGIDAPFDRMKHRYICDSCYFARPKNGWMLNPRCVAQHGLYVENKPIERGITDLKDICVLYRHKK